MGLADGRPSPVDGQYVIDCDVDAREGRGEVIATPDRAKATVFRDFTEAVRYWTRQSVIAPFRPDGEPNRPLTAYSVVIEP